MQPGSLVVDDFTYDVVRSARRRTVAIVVKPDASVQVRVPSRYPEWRIAELVRSKAEWIRTKRRKFQAMQSELEPRRYTDGEMFDYLGEPLTLRLVPGKDDGGCWREGRCLCVGSGVGNKADVIERWYRHEARKVIGDRAVYYQEKTGLSPVSVGIKRYRSRWGSCHHDGRIYFNWRLIMAPPFVIDYVVIHELCHLLHADHSSRFWARVEQYCHDYKVARNWLKEHGHRLDV